MLTTGEVPPESSQLIILGRGIEMVEGQPRLGESSEQRAEFATSYYYDHMGVFTEQDARIVCSGGFPRLSDQEFEGVSEASMMADILVRNGVPHQFIEKEGDSRSTLQNFVFSAPMINLGALTPERPLGVVAHAGHYNRAADLVDKVYGSNTSETGLIAPGESGLRISMQERAMRGFWRGVFAGVAERDTKHLLAREAQVTRIAGLLRRPLAAVIE